MVTVSGKAVTVPLAWLAQYSDVYDVVAGNASAVLGALAMNGRMSVVESYVLGLDPTNKTNDFRIVSFPMKADGTPDFVGMTVDPPPNQWNVPATWKVKGAPTLAGPWEDVPAGGGGLGETALPAMRFFKVEVVLP